MTATNAPPGSFAIPLMRVEWPPAPDGDGPSNQWVVGTDAGQDRFTSEADEELLRP
jgi:hypothetical protein